MESLALKNQQNPIKTFFLSEKSFKITYTDKLMLKLKSPLPRINIVHMKQNPD